MSEEREELIKALRLQIAERIAPHMFPMLGDVAAKRLAEMPSEYAPDTHLGAAVDAVIDLLAHQETSGWREPEGWKLVLVEPTEAMEDMGVAQLRHTREAGGGFGYSMMAAYRAMLNASPSPPTSQETT